MDKRQLQASPAWRYATPLQRDRLAHALNRDVREAGSPGQGEVARRRLSQSVVVKKP